MSRSIVERIWILSVAASLLVASVVGCSGRRHQDRFQWSEMLASIVAAKQAGRGSVYLDVFRVMPFEWEKLYVFPPYTSTADIEKALGFEWGGAKKTRLHERDDIALLVFVAGHTVLEYIEQPRSAGDFSRLQAGRPYSPREAYFECVREDKDGTPVFYFVEAER